MLWTRQVLTFASQISRVQACCGILKDKSGAVTWTEFLAAALCVSVCRNRRRVSVMLVEYIRLECWQVTWTTMNLDCAINLGLGLLPWAFPSSYCLPAFPMTGAWWRRHFPSSTKTEMARWAWKILPTTSHSEMKERFASENVGQNWVSRNWMFGARNRDLICGRVLDSGRTRCFWFHLGLANQNRCGLVPGAKVWLRHLPRQLQIIGDKGAKGAFFHWFRAVLSEFLCWILIGAITAHSPDFMVF